MRANIFKLLILITIFTPVLIHIEENGTTIDKPCYNSDSTFDVIRDSRSKLFVANYI